LPQAGKLKIENCKLQIENARKLSRTLAFPSLFSIFNLQFAAYLQFSKSIPRLEEDAYPFFEAKPL
jgi:hypothetical protein